MDTTWKLAQAMGHDAVAGVSFQSPPKNFVLLVCTEQRGALHSHEGGKMRNRPQTL